MSEDEELIYPEEWFPAARSIYPGLGELIDDSAMSIPGMRALGRQIWRDHVSPLLPVRPTGQTLVLRVALSAASAIERGVQLSEGIAREVEADSLFGAAAIARAQLELIGLMSHARDELPKVADDPTQLDELTMRFLLASRSLSDGRYRHFSTNNLIEAAKRQLGDHFGEDYGYLSDLTHPNALLVWAPHLLGDGEPPDSSVTEERAEVMIKIAGQGIHALAHNALEAVDWALEHDRLLETDMGEEQ